MEYEAVERRQGDPASGQRGPDTPWRRYLARSLDLSVCSALWAAVAALLFHVNLWMRSPGGELLDTAAALLLMLFLEPLCLHLWGSTPGKALLGLSIRSLEGGFLTYGQGLERTWGVLGQGMGYGIPVYNLVRQYKSYRLCKGKSPQPWDGECAYVLRDARALRWAALAGAYAALLFCTVGITALAALPPNRGEMTVAEFSENYNRLAAYHKELPAGSRLNDLGEWERDPGYDLYLDAAARNNLPQFSFEVENGVVAAVSFERESRGNGVIWNSGTPMVLAALSYSGAQEGMGPFSQERRRMVKTIQEGAAGFQSFQFTTGKIRVACDVSYKGYVCPEGQGVLFSEEGAGDPSFRMEFRMERIP